MSEAEDEERELRIELMKADIYLKQKQAIWETPRNIALLAGAVAAITAAVAGTLGYKIGSEPPRAINVHLDAPLVLPPSAKGSP